MRGVGLWWVEGGWGRCGRAWCGRFVWARLSVGGRLGGCGCDLSMGSVCPCPLYVSRRSCHQYGSCWGRVVWQLEVFQSCFCVLEIVCVSVRVRGRWPDLVQVLSFLFSAWAFVV